MPGRRARKAQEPDGQIIGRGLALLVHRPQRSDRAERGTERLRLSETGNPMPVSGNRGRQRPRSPAVRRYRTPPRGYSARAQTTNGGQERLCSLPSVADDARAERRVGARRPTPGDFELSARNGSSGAADRPGAEFSGSEALTPERPIGASREYASGSRLRCGRRRRAGGSGRWAPRLPGTVHGCLPVGRPVSFVPCFAEGAFERCCSKLSSVRSRWRRVGGRLCRARGAMGTVGGADRLTRGSAIRYQPSAPFAAASADGWRRCGSSCPASS
jgi:hypothetical protein